MLRRIGAIEERTMQRVLMKILHETETTLYSETWRRLRKYQGLWKDGNNNSSTDEDKSTSSCRLSELSVEPPSVRDAVFHDLDEEDSDDPHSEIAPVVIHPDEFRQKQSSINKSPTSNSNISGSGSAGSAGSAAATQAQRKHAAISL